MRFFSETRASARRSPKVTLSDFPDEVSLLDQSAKSDSESGSRNASHSVDTRQARSASEEEASRSTLPTDEWPLHFPGGSSGEESASSPSRVPESQEDAFSPKGKEEDVSEQVSSPIFASQREDGKTERALRVGSSASLKEKKDLFEAQMDEKVREAQTLLKEVTHGSLPEYNEGGDTPALCGIWRVRPPAQTPESKKRAAFFRLAGCVSLLHPSSSDDVNRRNRLSRIPEFLFLSVASKAKDARFRRKVFH